MNRICAESNKDTNKYENIQNQLSFADFCLHVIESFYGWSTWLLLVIRRFSVNVIKKENPYKIKQIQTIDLRMKL